MIKTWFNNLASRERLLVGVGGVLGGAILLFLLVIEPTAQAFGERQRRVAALEGQLEWMRETAADVQALRAEGAGGDIAGGDRPPYVVVEAALERAQLPSPSELGPAGDNDAARLAFEQAPFDPLVRFLGELRTNNGLRVTRARVQRQEDGQVSAQLTVERGE